jgi:hypothetical protein
VFYLLTLLLKHATNHTQQRCVKYPPNLKLIGKTAKCIQLSAN